jgi:hypothetical protein
MYLAKRRFPFELDDLKFIIYKYLGDAIDNQNPMMELDCNIHCCPTPSNTYGVRFFTFENHRYRLFLKVIPWYLKGDDTIGGYRIRFKFDTNNKHLITEALDQRNSELLKMLYDRFQVTLLSNFYVETINRYEFCMVDILAVRAEDITNLLP